MKFKSSLLKKFAAVDLATVLDDYDQKGFMEWVDENKNNYKVGNILENLDEASKRIFAKFLSKDAKAIISLGEHENDLPYPACGSVLDGLGIKTPTSLVQVMPAEMLVDEYFGMCYHTNRERYTPEGMDLLKKRISVETTFKGLIDSDSQSILYGLGVVVLADLTSIWGEKQLKDWWLSSTEAERKSLVNDYYCEILIEELEAAYGRPGGNGLPAGDVSFDDPSVYEDPDEERY